MHESAGWRVFSPSSRRRAAVSSRRSFPGGIRKYSFLRHHRRAAQANRVRPTGFDRRPGVGRTVCIQIPGGEGSITPFRIFNLDWRSHSRWARSPGVPLCPPIRPPPKKNRRFRALPVPRGARVAGYIARWYGDRSSIGGRRWRRFEVDALKTTTKPLASIAICPGSCEALDTAENSYRAIVEDLTEPLCRLLADGMITYANEAFCSLFQQRFDEISGMRIHDILKPEIMRELSPLARRLDAANPAFTREFRISGADGVDRWYRSVCRVIFNDEGSIYGYQVIGHDITERKRREARNTRINDQKLVLLADAASDAIAVVDCSDRIIYWNSAAETLFGYTTDEIVGSNVRRLSPHDHPGTSYTEGIQDAISTAPGGIVRLQLPDVRFARRDGSTFPAALSIAAVRTDGEWSRVAIIHDTSAQKAREQALHREMERTGTLLRIAARLNGSITLDAVFDALCEETSRALSIPMVVVSLPDRHRGMLISARSARVSRDAPTSLPVIPLQAYERELHDQGPVITILDRLLQTGEASGQNSPEQPPRILASAAILHNGNLIGALNVATSDGLRTILPEEIALLKGIVDQAALAIVNARHFEERKAYERRLQASLDEKTALLKEVHHRVKNNMQVVSSLLSLQSRLIENDAIRACIQESENRVKSLALVHECLYRSESIAAVDIGAYVRRLANDLVQSYALQNYVSVSVETVGIIVVSGDVAIPLGLILNELISNSLRHAFTDRERGSITIWITRLPGRCLIVRYRDDGIGIPSAIIDHPPATLGLQLIRILVAQLEGTITFRSAESGTTVEIIVSDGPMEDACTA